MSNRRRAGLALAATGGTVVQGAADPWRVASQSSALEGYLVTRHTNVEGETAYECSCADHAYRLLRCKHIHAALDWQVAEAYVISLFVGGKAARIEAWLEEELLGWLDEEVRDKRRIIWRAYQCVAERARAIDYQRRAA
ncbi:MAG: hypothetical protein KDD73_16790 [Anaerolineales bacterium]|nr:hypothetical protein [Anaerolineales bacterium]